MKNWQLLIYRLMLVALCVGIGTGAIVHLYAHLDPLARYPYANKANRELILTYLSDKDIDYVINNQLKPAQYLPFIKQEGFEIENTRYYQVALATQPTQRSFIVNFVNTYHDRFSLDELKDLLSHYSYLDLQTYFDSNQKAQLVSDPSRMDCILNKNKTVFNYVPENLVQVDNIWIKQEAAQSLQDMKRYFEAMLVGQTMTFLDGYESYDACQQLYEQSKRKKGWILPAGQNEQQLGYTVILANDTKEVLDENDKALEAWLIENAANFGFVIRYPENNDEKMVYRPFVLRYVGKKNARAMVSEDKTMTTFDFEEDNQ